MLYYLKFNINLLKLNVNDSLIFNARTEEVKDPFFRRTVTQTEVC